MPSSLFFFLSSPFSSTGRHSPFAPSSPLFRALPLFSALLLLFVFFPIGCIAGFGPVATGVNTPQVNSVLFQSPSLSGRSTNLGQSQQVNALISQLHMPSAVHAPKLALHGNRNGGRPSHILKPSKAIGVDGTRGETSGQGDAPREEEEQEKEEKEEEEEEEDAGVRQKQIAEFPALLHAAFRQAMWMKEGAKLGKADKKFIGLALPFFQTLTHTMAWRAYGPNTLALALSMAVSTRLGAIVHKILAAEKEMETHKDHEKAIEATKTKISTAADELFDAFRLGTTGEGHPQMLVERQIELFVKGLALIHVQPNYGKNMDSETGELIKHMKGVKDALEKVALELEKFNGGQVFILREKEAIDQKKKDETALVLAKEMAKKMEHFDAFAKLGNGGEAKKQQKEGENEEQQHNGGEKKGHSEGEKRKAEHGEGEKTPPRGGHLDGHSGKRQTPGKK